MFERTPGAGLTWKEFHNLGNGFFGSPFTTAFAASPDGAHLYLARKTCAGCINPPGPAELVVLSRDPTSGALTLAQRLVHGVDLANNALMESIAVSPRGDFVFLGADEFIDPNNPDPPPAELLVSLTVFRRDETTGLLAQEQQIVNPITESATGLFTTGVLAVSSDAFGRRDVYTGGDFDQKIVQLKILDCLSAGKSSFALKTKPGKPNKDKLKWRWKKGKRTVLADIGTPSIDTDYTLSVFDESGLQHEFTIPGGQATLWKGNDKGWTYKDKAGSSDGVTGIKLKRGDNGKASAIINGKGVRLALGTLNITTPMTVQLRNSLGRCWETTFTSAVKNDSNQFKAKQ